MITLTSFKKHHEAPAGLAFSVAFYQPSWMDKLMVIYPLQPVLRQADVDHGLYQGPPVVEGSIIRPKWFLNHPYPLDTYRDTLWYLYLSREQQIKNWFFEPGYASTGDVRLCCWCPYEKAAKRQLETWGTFVCHTEVIRHFLGDRLGIHVEIDEDRWEMKDMFPRE